MKNDLMVFRNSLSVKVNLKDKPEDMSQHELIKELLARQTLEYKMRQDQSERGQMLRELEMHHLELEIQNRQILEHHKELEDLNKRYVDLFDFAPVGYMTVDQKGKIVELNLNAAKLLEGEKIKLTGKSLERWVSAESKDVFLSHLNECTQGTGDQISCEILLQKPGMKETHIELFSTLHKQADGSKQIRMALIDRAWKKRAEHAEAQTQEILEVQRLREAFISSISHDLRTPLTSSKLCAQMLDGAMNDIDKKKKLYKLLVEELDRADAMIKELLDTSQLNETKSAPLSVRRCDLSKLSHKCLEKIRILRPDLQLIFRATGDLTINCSRDGIERVIENLLSNAIKYGTPDLPITLSLADCGHEIEMIVHNHGNPIPALEQQRVFEAFHRTESARKSTAQGWGLGLSLVHNLVERHNGTITLESKLGDGTSFIIRIPKKSP